MIVKKISRLTFLIAAAALLLTGCTPIVYDMPAITENENINTAPPPPVTTAVTEPVSPDKYHETRVPINGEAFSETLQLEEVCENQLYNYLMGYEGSGYIQIDRHEYATFKVHVPAAQYYKLTVRLCAFGTGVDVIVGGKLYNNGEYDTFDGVSKGVIYAEDITGFSPFTINGIYLKKGDNTITLQSVYGMAYMDQVTIENGKTVSDSVYSITNAPVNPNADIKTMKIMNYFSEIYGKKTLTGQQVTIGTNAEIAAISAKTDRLPAIRISDLTFAQKNSPYYDEELTDIDLAEEWSSAGGLVGYNWTWYSPSDSSHYLSSMTDFDFADVYTDSDISGISMERIEKLFGEGEITRECYEIMVSLDEMIETLKILQSKDITVLFSPLANGGMGGYWWSDSADSYKWLWQTMVKRCNNYYGLSNIIWVWNGGSTEFYPGDEYVDIIGENIYNPTGDSGNGRFMGTSEYRSARAVAMTDCLILPDPDILTRDNAKWLWFSLGKGDNLIDENGVLTNRYTTAELLDRGYNHECFVTLDELPDFSAALTQGEEE